MTSLRFTTSKLLLLRKVFPNRSYMRSRVLASNYASSANSTVSAQSSDLKESTKPDSYIENEGEEFRRLLRESDLMNLGDPENKIVRGKIYHVVNDDLYIDFGWKFNCVCVKPAKGGELYVRGAEVLLKLKSLELSSKFLGADKGLTLLEADASIIKLLSSPVKKEL